MKNFSGGMRDVEKEISKWESLKLQLKEHLKLLRSLEGSKEVKRLKSKLKVVQHRINQLKLKRREWRSLEKAESLRREQRI